MEKNLIGIRSKRDNFISSIFTLVHRTCGNLFPNKKSYPIDEEAEEEIRFYAGILFARGLWTGLDLDEYETPELRAKANRVLTEWKCQTLERASTDFCVCLNQIVDRKSSEKSDTPILFLPNFQSVRGEIKGLLTSMLSEELAIKEQNHKKLALGY